MKIVQRFFQTLFKKRNYSKNLKLLLLQGLDIFLKSRLRVKGKVSLPYGSVIGNIDNVVVVDNIAARFFALGLGEANKDEIIGPDLPAVAYDGFDFNEVAEMVWLNS